MSQENIWLYKAVWIIYNSIYLLTCPCSYYSCDLCCCDGTCFVPSTCLAGIINGSLLWFEKKFIRYSLTPNFFLFIIYSYLIIITITIVVIKHLDEITKLVILWRKRWMNSIHQVQSFNMYLVSIHIKRMWK